LLCSLIDAAALYDTSAGAASVESHALSGCVAASLG